MNYRYILGVLVKNIEMLCPRDQVEVSIMIRYFERKGFLPERKIEQLKLIYRRIKPNKQPDVWREAQKNFGL